MVIYDLNRWCQIHLIHLMLEKIVSLVAFGTGVILIGVGCLRLRKIYLNDNTFGKEWRVATVATVAIGCRNPDPRINAAFVYAQAFGLPPVAAFFKNGVDYVRHGVIISDAICQYNLLIMEGWIRMSNEDLSKTAGLKFNKTTKTNIEDIYSPHTSTTT
jgi:hypothetical protein